MAFFNNDNDDFNSEHHAFSGPVLLTIGLVSGAILVILLIVLASNNSMSGKRNFQNQTMLNKATPTPEFMTAADVAAAYTDEYGNKDIERLYRDKKLRAEDFDFWNMYDNDKHFTPHDERADEEADRTEETPSLSPSPSPTPEGSPEPELLKNVELNKLDFTNIKSVNDQMGYYIDGNKISKLGVDISEENGVVDFGLLKANGVDFVMLRAGSRGYDSGLIKPDNEFEKNIKAASEEGLDIGVYFSSRAVTVEEATQEASFCVEHMEEYKVKYPVCFYFEGELFDSARTDTLEREDRTKMAEAFLSYVSNHGYTGALYGTQKYVLEDLVPDGILKKYDVALIDSNKIPEYPYQYKLWKYSGNEMIPGLEKPGAYIISFVDYAGR